MPRPSPLRVALQHLAGAPTPSSPAVWSRVHSSVEEWRSEWAARVESKDDNPGWKQIVRGVVLGKRRKTPIRVIDRVISGEVTAEEILGLFSQHRVGSYWYLLGQNGQAIEDSEDFATSEGHLGLDNTLDDVEKYRRERLKTAWAEIPVLLIAQRPVDWHPDDNIQTWGGNSWIDPRIWPTVDLIELRYFNGKRWIQLPVNVPVRL